MLQLKPPLPLLFADTAVSEGLKAAPFAIRCQTTFVIPAPVLEAARRLGRATNCTLYSVIVAALKLILFAYTKQPDIRLGTMAANRNIPGAERVIGFFANPICLRTDLRSVRTIRELLKAVHLKVRDAAAHQDLPFDVLAHSLDVAFGVERSSIFQVMLLWSSMPVKDALFPGVTLSPFINSTSESAEDTIVIGRSSLEMVFELQETASDVRGTLTYRLDRLSADTARELISDLNCCLAKAAEKPELLISELTEDIERRRKTSGQAMPERRMVESS